MTKPLTILFQLLDGIGHVNACIGVGEVLRESGHRIIFAINEQWRGKLSVYGFEEELISDPERDPNQDPAKFWTERAKMMEVLMESPFDVRLDLLFNKILIEMLEKAKKTEDSIFEEIVNRYKPDVIIIDNFFVCPSLIKTGIPWVLLCSGNPLFILPPNECLPPPNYGLSVNSNRNEWNGYRLKLKELMNNSHNSYNEWLGEYGLKEISETSFLYTSPFLTIYDFPKEIDYSNEVSIPSNFYGFDNFMRSDKSEEFVLPEELRNKSGKLVYFSLGSMASGIVKLMKRLVSILSKSPHRFIVSMGQFHDQYELADNMWGQKFLPQTKILPLVDLVITHGGNNTLTESFYFGKPMIVLPLFGDQYDNAQRLQDTGYGIRLDTFNCTENELLEAIEKIVNDSELKLKLEKISQRIQTSNSLNKIVDLIEALVN